MLKKILYISSIILLAVIVYFYFNNQLSKQPSQISQNQNLETFSNSYVVGYEGDFDKIFYSLQYPKNNFELSSKITSPSIITIKNKKSGTLNTLSFFYNGAAGFTSSQEFWENLYKSQCIKCVQTTNKINQSLSNDIVSYSDTTDEWIIFSKTPGFITAHITKPSDEVVKIIESLVIKSEKTSAPEFISLKIYFSNNKIKPAQDCNEVIAVERIVTKNAKVATAALEMLFDGPNDSEINQGYVTNIPIGTSIKSIEIKDEIAYVDLNSQADKGGGSCSMAARVAQIKQTLLQFSTIKDVVLSIDGRLEDIFQP